MFWSTAQKYGKTCVDFLLTPPPKGQDRQDPFALAALVNLDTDSYEWGQVIEAMREYAHNRVPAVPLTYAPDKKVWVANPTPGDFLAEQVWDIAYCATRLSRSASNATWVVRSHISSRKIALPMAQGIGAMNAAVKGLVAQEDQLRAQLIEVREQEEAAGLI